MALLKGEIDHSHLNLKIQTLTKELNDKEKQFEFAQNEIKKLTEQKNEILKLIHNKDPNLNAEINERLITITERSNKDEITKKPRIFPMNITKSKNAHLALGDNSHTNFNILLQDHFIEEIKNKMMKSETVNENSLDEHEQDMYIYYSGNVEEIKKKHSNLNIDDYSDIQWHYLLVFPNPDYEEKTIYLSADKTKSLYDDCFFPDRRLNGNTAGLSENKVYMSIINKIFSNNAARHPMNNGVGFSRSMNNN
jgi:hypothetical protein